MMIKCGITGHSGNLGKNFLKKTNNFKFYKFKGDIRQKKDVEKWLKNKSFDLIIHFASIVPISTVNKNYKVALQVNCDGTKNLVQTIKKNNVKIKWFFFSSSSHVYPFSKYKINEKNILKPITKYGKTKMLAEKIVCYELKKTNINFCIGRIFSIFDNKQKEFLLKSLIKKINVDKKIIELENLNHFRDFVSLDQISKIIFKLWKKKYQGTINIGNGKKTNLKRIANLIAKKYGKKILFKQNKSTTMVADISKLKRFGWKSKELNFIKYF
tara:strand:- start:14703 stop:15512 length:810 start_codon:yes stop_codon:yes gene_type:complete